MGLKDRSRLDKATPSVVFIIKSFYRSVAFKGPKLRFWQCTVTYSAVDFFVAFLKVSE